MSFYTAIGVDVDATRSCSMGLRPGLLVREQVRHRPTRYQGCGEAATSHPCRSIDAPCSLTPNMLKAVSSGSVVWKE